MRKIPHVCRLETVIEGAVGKRGGSAEYSHTHKRDVQSHGEEKNKTKKTREEEQVILSSHTETYRNKNRHMKPHIKRATQTTKGL